MAVREIRETKMNRYTVQGVAEAMGVSKPTYRKWERDPESMTGRQAKRLAGILGCRVSELYKGN